MRKCCLVVTTYLYALYVHRLANNRMNIHYVDVNHTTRIKLFHTEASYRSNIRFNAEKITGTPMLHRLFCGIRYPRSRTQSKVN